MKSRTLLALGYPEPVRFCDSCFEVCSVRDAFMDVVRNGDVKAVEAALTQGHVSADDSTGTQTPLLVASSRGCTDVMRVLLDNGANVHGFPRWRDPRGEQSAAELDGWVDSGPKPRGDSPLHYSAMIGSVECVQMLVRLKADLNRPSTRHGETPLHKAVLFGRTEVVEELLAAGASTSHGNDRGFTPVQLCELCGEEAICAAFRLHGCIVNPCTVASVRNGFVTMQNRPELLWEVLSALYLYKRPRRARLLLSELLVATHAVGYPVDQYLPQLCDLALHEPPGDIAIKQALISLAISTPLMAFSLAFYITSVSDANPASAKTFCDVLESVVFGGANTPSTPGSAAGSVRGDTPSSEGQEAASLESNEVPAALAPLMRKSSSKQSFREGTSTPRSSSNTPRARLDAQRIELGSKEYEALNQSSASLGERTSERTESSADFLQQYGQQRCAWAIAETPRERRSMLLKCRKFLKVLRELGTKLPLVAPAVRARELQGAMEKINERLPPCLYIPLIVGHNRMFWVLSILPEEAKVFSTNTRAPFYCLAEVRIVEDPAGPDLWGSICEEAHDPADHAQRVRERASAYHGDGEGADAERQRAGPGRPRGGRASDQSYASWVQKGPGGNERGHTDGPLHSPASQKQSVEQEQILESIFGESWTYKRERVRASSPHGHLENWGLIAYICKSGDDLRQEQFAMQLIEHFHLVFSKAKTNLWLRPYQVIATANDAGLIQVVPDAVSLHSLREKWGQMSGPSPAESSLAAFFCAAYGPPSCETHKKAQQNFIESMAAYAVVCYLLKVKDRNDGNLLLTRQGHIVHIDFGYLISNSPGDIAFEQAPFKLTSELVDIMGGKDSSSFHYFRELCVQGFLEARKPQNYQKILMMVEMMANGVGGELGIPCVSGQPPAELVSTLKSLYMLGRTDEEVRVFVHDLVDQSLDNWYTKQYDYFQVLQKRWTNLFT